MSVNETKPLSSSLTCSDVLSADFLGDLLESVRDGLLVVVPPPVTSGSAALLAGLLTPLLLSVSAELALTGDTPGCECDALRASHGDDVPLEVALHDVPLALVDAEGGQAVVAGVLVGLGNNPCGGIGDTLRRGYAFS
jgi:hypothetical protein